MPPSYFTVLIVDDHPLLRLGVASIINAQPDMRVCGEAGSGPEALTQFRRLHPDLVLMDLRLPDGSGLEAIRAIRAEAPAARCVVLTTYEGDEDIHQALAAGAQGYLIKGMSHETLVGALRQARAGHRVLPPPVARSLASRPPNSELSPREREVLLLMAQGNSNRQIAQKLGITEATVKSHVSVILLNLGVEDRTSAVITALQRGLAHL